MQRVKFASALLVGLVLAPTPSVAGEAFCAGTRIVVRDWNEAEGDLICSAARAALVFLSGAGLDLSGGLAIVPLSQAPGNGDAHVLGRFEPGSREIRPSPFDTAVAEARDHPRAFGVPMSRALWQSYIAHELAHAVAEPRFAAGVRRSTASEYLAAVVQLATLPEPVRREILAVYRDVAGFAHVREISGTYYALDPARFAVKAYRHYLRLGAEWPDFLNWLLHEGLAD